ncbi:MAG TPA: Smr/MutS family protein [Sphingomicrobium sp.]|nr:Smr/MutS family protein [Sphingomicrobium sp.]
MRLLGPDEAALWARVTATIAPLSREKVSKEPAEQLAPQMKRAPAPARLPVRSPVTPAARARSHLTATLDGSWDKKLRSGNVQPDRILDLHGMTLDRAWDAIDAQLERAIASGDRVVLLITGHHRPGEPPVQRGKIRAAVHDWLAASRHAPRIAAVRGAHRRHGGGGSLYLILRRYS